MCEQEWVRNHGKGAGPGIPRLLPSFQSSRAGPRVSEPLSTAWLIVKSLFFLKSLVRSHGAPLFPVPYNFSRPRASQEFSFPFSFSLSFLPSSLISFLLPAFSPPFLLLPFSLSSLSSFLSFCPYYLFSRLWDRRGVSETTFTEDLLFARNLAYIISLNLWNNAKQWAWLFSFFPYFYYFIERRDKLDYRDVKYLSQNHMANTGKPEST